MISAPVPRTRLINFDVVEFSQWSSGGDFLNEALLRRGYVSDARDQTVALSQLFTFEQRDNASADDDERNELGAAAAKHHSDAATAASRPRTRDDMLHTQYYRGYVLFM